MISDIKFNLKVFKVINSLHEQHEFLTLNYSNRIRQTKSESKYILIILHKLS